MAKKDVIVQDGEVIKVEANGICRVQLKNGHTVVAMRAGKMKQHRISLLVGDTVRLEISPYDLNRGRIVFRY